ncbi:hypothetical protein [Quadrisphaera sp. DSM 44207]|uniref:hypothetical protein n=1 Tax=Quadrisphaera sp. DSM 44207 TaxID=1881057 RepID=UPI00115FFDB1|nr:hypothetical protein [Quadrisphaera sp. DSM 44207]
MKYDPVGHDGTRCPCSYFCKAIAVPNGSASGLGSVKVVLRTTCNARQVVRTRSTHPSNAATTSPSLGSTGTEAVKWATVTLLDPQDVTAGNGDGRQLKITASADQLALIAATVLVLIDEARLLYEQRRTLHH